jgi:hypothetical protein
MALATPPSLSSRPPKASSLLARLGLRLVTSDVFDFLQNTVEPPSHCALALQTRGPNLPGLLEVAFVRRRRLAPNTLAGPESR